MRIILALVCYSFSSVCVCARTCECGVWAFVCVCVFVRVCLMLFSGGMEIDMKKIFILS